jgi:hypothetical protein
MSGMDISELQRQLQEKDHMIQQLRSRVEGHSSESAVMSKKRDERLQEIDTLKAELMRERNRNDVAVVNKKVARLEKERKE